MYDNNQVSVMCIYSVVLFFFIYKSTFRCYIGTSKASFFFGFPPILFIS